MCKYIYTVNDFSYHDHTIEHLKRAACPACQACSTLFAAIIAMLLVDRRLPDW